jgi:zinc protease
VGTRSTFTLSDGLHVVLEENHAAPVVALQVWMEVGSADDPPGLEGAANVVQHLMQRAARGGGATPASEARTGAWTSYDETVVHTLVAAPFVDDGLRALSSALTSPSAPTAADFEAARAEARADLRATRGDPQRLAAAAAMATAFSVHPYRRPLLGTDGTLADLTLGRLRAFYEQAWGAPQATLVIVGDFDARAIREKLASLFGAWRRGTAPSPRAHEPEQTEPRVAVSTADIGDAELALAWRTADFRADDRAALELLAAVLGQGPRTRLDDEFVRNRQMARDTRAFLFAARDAGLLVTSATLGAGPIEETTAAILDEVGRLAREGPTREELARARTFVERQEVTEKAGVEGYAHRLGLYATVAGEPGREAAYLKRLREVDAADVQQVAARCFRAANLSVVATLPVLRGARSEDRVPRLLARLRVAVTSVSARTATMTAKAARGADVRDVVTYLLPSGVRLLILSDDTADQISVRAVWSGGARIENTHLSGAASLIARLFVRGTKTRTADQLAAELGDVGGRLDGFAGLDILGLRADFLASRWEHGLDLVVDCLRNPRFAEEDVEQDRRVMLEAIRLRDNDGANVAQRLFEESLFAGRPYHEDLLGTSESVAALTRRRVLDFYRSGYPLRGLTVAVVGAVEADRVADRFQALFADAPAAALGATSTPPAVAPPVLEPKEIVRFGPAGQAHLVLGYPGVTPSDPDRLALDLIAEILNRPARRLAALREPRGLAEEIGARSVVAVDGGAFAVHVAARPESLDLAVAAVRAELARLIEAGVTPDELATARRALIARRALAFERRGAVAMALALGAALGDATRSPKRDLDDLAKLKLEDVARVARRILEPKREVLTVVRPRELGRAPTSGRDLGANRSALALAGRPALQKQDR